MHANRTETTAGRAWSPSTTVLAAVAALLLYILSSGPAALLNELGPRSHTSAEDGHLEGVFAPRRFRTEDRSRWTEPFATIYIPLVWLKESLPTNNPLVWYWDRFARKWQTPPGVI